MYNRFTENKTLKFAMELLINGQFQLWVIVGNELEKLSERVKIPGIAYLISMTFFFDPGFELGSLTV